MNAYSLILSLLFCISFHEVLFSEKNKRETELLTPITSIGNIEPGKQNFNLLVLGGGYSPSGNEVSLESNVKYLHRMQQEIGLGKFKLKTLFADGMEKTRDIQYRDPNFTVPESNLILAEIFGSTRGIFNQYRNNFVNADGPSSVKELDGWIKEVNSTAESAYNLIYFTGHGGKGEKKSPLNTSTYLWNNQKVKVSDFTHKLDSLPLSHSIILVMVQCYSGGFANYIFREGDSKKGLHPQIRAGFFATVHDRVAAGCTPDIREENYQEYSTHFWEALCGESRIGKKITKPDFNGDGYTSLSEAHAYVIINANTIDLPIKTSDLFLRRFSSFEPPKEANQLVSLIDQKREIESESDSNLSDRKVPQQDWIFRTDPISEILILASPESKATIKALAKRLSFQDESLFEKAENKIEELKKRREELAKSKKKKDEQKKNLKNKIKSRLLKEWPELANTQHPIADRLKQPAKPSRLLTVANQNNEWKDLKMRKEEILKIESQRFKLEKIQVLAMRLKYEIENVILKIALPKINSPDIIERFSRIEKLERTILRQSKG